MTIDERILWMKERAKTLETDGYSFLGQQYRENVSMLEELKWYRSQDLINRNDIPEYCKLDCERIHCETCDKTFSFCNEIMQIPKAEPPKK